MKPVDTMGFDQSEIIIIIIWPTSKLRISHCPYLTKVGPAEGDDVGVVIVQTKLLLVELPAAVSAPGGRVLLETLLSELVVLLTQLFVFQHLVRAVDPQELVMGPGVILKENFMYDMYSIPLTLQIDCIIQQIYGKLITHCSWTLTDV